MKKLKSFLCTCLIGLSCYAENTLFVVIHETQGQTAFSFDRKPTVSFTDTDVKLTCSDMEVLYSLSNYLKLTIESSDPSTSVDILSADSFSVTDDKITVRGCGDVSLFSVEGKMLLHGEANAEGVATISIANLKREVYIVKTNSKSFKIIKK